MRFMTESMGCPATAQPLLCPLTSTSLSLYSLGYVMPGSLEIKSKKHTLYIFQEDHSLAFIRFIYSYWERVAGPTALTWRSEDNCKADSLLISCEWVLEVESRLSGLATGDFVHWATSPVHKNHLLRKSHWSHFINCIWRFVWQCRDSHKTQTVVFHHCRLFLNIRIKCWEVDLEIHFSVLPKGN